MHCISAFCSAEIHHFLFARAIWKMSWMHVAAVFWDAQNKVHACKQAAMRQRDDKMRCIYRNANRARASSLWNERKRMKLMRNARFLRISNDRFMATPSLLFQVPFKFDEFKECTVIRIGASAFAFIKWIIAFFGSPSFEFVFNSTPLFELLAGTVWIQKRRNRWHCLALNVTIKGHDWTHIPCSIGICFFQLIHLFH